MQVEAVVACLETFYKQITVRDIDSCKHSVTHIRPWLKLATCLIRTEQVRRRSNVYQVYLKCCGLWRRNGWKLLRFIGACLMMEAEIHSETSCITKWHGVILHNNLIFINSSVETLNYLFFCLPKKSLYTPACSSVLLLSLSALCGPHHLDKRW